MSGTTCLPVVEDVAWVRVEQAAEVGRARRIATTTAEQVGFPDVRVAEVGLAVTEIGTNLHKHARAGAVLVRVVRTAERAELEVLALDSGPGIADLALAHEDGRSTTGTLGLGLGVVARMAESLSITSRPGSGTALVARFAARREAHPAPPDEAAGLTRALGDEPVCGDAYAARRGPGRLSLMMCDGSGHGPLAASAANAAVRVFCQGPALPPEEVVARVHAELRGTRGGAVAVADLDLRARTVRFVGLGNIGAAVLGDGRKRSMVSMPGVAGYQARTIRAFDYPLPEGGAVVLHSDGLTERWTVDADLLAAPPVLAAATLLRDAGVRRDDACVLVGKPR